MPTPIDLPALKSDSKTATPVACGAILLAAGFSRRFGAVKLDAYLDTGQTLFEASLNRLMQALPDVIVVGRPELNSGGTYRCLTEMVNPPLLTLCDDADAGMGHSLAAGVRAAPDHWHACLICLADMPKVNPDTLQRLISQAQPDRIVIPVYKQQRGHPVCFGRQFFAALLQSQGDTGGKHVIQQNPGVIQEMPCEDAGILFDIDRPGDLP